MYLFRFVGWREFYILVMISFSNIRIFHSFLYFALFFFFKKATLCYCHSYKDFETLILCQDFSKSFNTLPSLFFFYCLYSRLLEVPLPIRSAFPILMDLILSLTTWSSLERSTVLWLEIEKMWKSLRVGINVCSLEVSLGIWLGQGGGEDLICMLLNPWEGETACFVPVSWYIRSFVHSCWSPPSRFFILFPSEKGPGKTGSGGRVRKVCIDI